ncbi:VWA domain-containing protein [Phytohabitans sp. ZYX-F-186]|uniref:Mg-protoporphyrin IX chelatase n=1 Tax=Phytohabitans maris TaxID=3071409 RepID=A0ABU0ZRM3_9ACTN|nr:VWA domain-containing protein [Phytohabitans sp. ZYX-F-186]MDQ7909689.1 VWA domain-containing protein [Phytohabitans sp. ZYX-F-186]
MPAAYPFSAIVGLADLRLALLLTAVNPAIGGVLVRGEKGTAKSTVVRALAILLPELDAVRGCRFGCDPSGPDPECPDGPHDATAPAVRRRSSLVELPVGATEDRVVGTLDIQRALKEGVKAYEPGLLATAHRGLLYVDEVNLLPDHLVDLLLDAAAMGRAHVERDGVSVKHAARFLLVGTMNPEEGEPRPQLVDRFGLVVSVTSPDEPAPRAEVVRRRLAYDADPDGFAARWAAEDASLAHRIADARERLAAVELPDRELDRIARICLAYGVDGLRADIVVARAALTLAAWHGRDAVTAEDVRDAARLALPHRRRRDPLDPPGTDEERLEETLSNEDFEPEPEPEPPGGGAPRGEDGVDGAESEGGAGEQPVAAPGQAYRPRVLTLPKTGERAHAGRRSLAYARRGRVVGARLPLGAGAPHLPATLRAAAARGSRTVAPGDLREAVHVGREANLVLFVVDASGSMAARQRMSTVKAAVLSLLRDAYQRRDRVGMITFRGTGADEVLPPTSSHEVGVQRLARLRTGGRTPLAAGLEAAARTLRAERRRDPRRRPLLVLVTDGRNTSGADPLTVVPSLAGTSAVVVDCEAGPVRLGLARRLAAALDAPCVPLAQLSATNRMGRAA